MPTVKIDGKSVNYLTGVNGIAPGRLSIIFVHGAGGNAMVWQNQRRGLDRGVNTICPDLPGHGESPGPSCKSIGEYSHWLLRFVRTLKLSGVVLAGHSMGGGVALEAAIRGPEQLDGLVLIGSGARLRVSSEIFQELKTDFGVAAAQLVRRCYGPESSDKMIKWGLEKFLEQRPEVVVDDFRVCNEFDRVGQIDGIQNRTLVLCGSEDNMTPPKYSQYLAEHLQQATLRIIEGAGHMVMVQDPFKVNTEILKFLATG
jgi:pimeloyl-ACP methyl ester carboxylesterase